MDDADRIVFANEVIQTLRQQYELAAVLAFNETLHPRPPTRSPEDSNSTAVFTQPRTSTPIPKARAEGSN
jgi:hypothetical protein